MRVECMELQLLQLLSDVLRPLRCRVALLTSFERCKGIMHMAQLRLQLCFHGGQWRRSGMEQQVGASALYTALSSLFRQAGLQHANAWTWGDEYAPAQQSSPRASGRDEHAGAGGVASARTMHGIDEDLFHFYTSGAGADRSSGSPASTGALEQFLLRHRGEAHHFEEVSKHAKHDFLLRTANLRLQGIKLVFEVVGSARGDELHWTQQARLLDVYERALDACTLFKAPNTMVLRKDPQHAAHHTPRPSPWAPARGAAAATGGSMEPEQPSVPFSQTVRMPDGFADMFAQIKQQQMKEEGQRPVSDAIKAETERIAAEEGTGSSDPSAATTPPLPQHDDSFESRRSPFSRVATVFSSSVPHSVVDGRGRLVLSVLQPGSEWGRFFNSTPALIAAARATQAHHRALKMRERQVADAMGVSDVFCETRLLVGGPVGTLLDEQGVPFPLQQTEGVGCSPAVAYQQLLERLQRDAHLLGVLRRTFPRANEISLRVMSHPVDSHTGELPPASTCFSVDPTLGLLLTPLHATAAHIRDAILERGQECVQIGVRAAQEAEQHTAALLRTKRHLRLRSLTLAPHVSREQSLECAQRLSRVYGSMRDHLQYTHLHIDDRYAVCDKDGRITLPWNWG